MPKIQFPFLAKALTDLTPRQRELRAMVFETSDQPLLQALALEIRNFNTVENAEMAQLDVDQWREQRTQLDTIEAELPAPGGDKDRLAAQQQADAAFTRLEGESYIDGQLYQASKAFETRLPDDAEPDELPPVA